MREILVLDTKAIPDVCTDNWTSIQVYSFRSEDLSTAIHVIIGTVIIMTSMFSILGNLLTCLIVYRKTAMRSAINLLLTNMALADLAMATTVMPYVLCSLLKTNLHVHVVVCVIFSILKDTFTCVISFSLLIVSLDRYYIIVCRRDGLCSRMAKRYIILTWVGAALVALPQLISLKGSPNVYYDSTLCGQYICRRQLATVIYSIFSVCAIFFVPVTAMLYLYVAILRTIQKCARKINNHPRNTVCVSVTQYSCKLGLPTVAMPVRFSGDFSAKRRAFSTIFLLFIAVFVCWFPYMTHRLVSLGVQSLHNNVCVTYVFLCIGFLKSTLYPVTYYYRNKKFRSACNQIVPSIELSLKLYSPKTRRINPQSIYEYSISDTRV